MNNWHDAHLIGFNIDQENQTAITFAKLNQTAITFLAQLVTRES
jgi:hypothetical protein